MKFKLIFLLFNGIIAVSFLFVFLMPLFFLGPEYSRVFWLENWYLAAVFILIIGGLNTYFALNRQLFSLLEAEDWQGLRGYLEYRVFTKKRFSQQHLRILINTYIVLSEPDKIRNLETELNNRRSRLVPRLALEFGIPRLLRNDPDEMIEYYEKYRNHPKAEQRDWLTWSYSFAVMQKQRSEEARDILLKLCKQTREPLVRLFSLYLLDAFRETDADLAKRVDEYKTEFRRLYGSGKLQREIEKNRANLQVVVLARLVKNAEEWVMSDSNTTEDAGTVSGNGSTAR
ncbi:MAG: hypothetical protein EA428_14625 [Spirochaetaceae bacterium]|nr:MAG: hypothetical protein EA428_14625 [Spirochaetaceae bacterium]